MNKGLLLTALVAVVAVSVFASGVFAPDTRRTENFGDPIGNYNFKLQIDGVDAGYVASVSGLSVQHEVIEYANGDELLVRKRPGLPSFSNIIIKKNYDGSTVLNDWVMQVKNGEFSRKSISIILNDHKNEEIKRWNLFEAFPVRWSLSELDGKGNKAI
jgi:phage tail-like protein